jgi:hypothetical protein
VVPTVSEVLFCLTCLSCFPEIVFDFLDDSSVLGGIHQESEILDVSHPSSQSMGALSICKLGHITALVSYN